jgi:hypothetical protein
MPKKISILAIAGVLALGLLAAGCGSDDSSTTSVSVDDTAASTTVSGDDTSVTADDTSSDSSGGVDTEAFLSECNDAVAGTPAEAAGQSACQQAADALEQCAGAANDDSSIAICQKAADEAVKQLQAAG